MITPGVFSIDSVMDEKFLETFAGHFRSRVSELLLISGITEAKINTEIIDEQIGSAIYKL